MINLITTRMGDHIEIAIIVSNLIHVCQTMQSIVKLRSDEPDPYFDE